MKKFRITSHKTLLKRVIRKVHLRTWIAFGILLIILPVIFLSLFKSQQTDAAWYNDGWAYRKKVPITDHTGAETNKYFSVTVDTSDTTKFQSDCGDIRFTDNTGALLQYYISSGCSSASTVLHVLVPTFPAGATDYYMYYGNAAAPNGFSNADFTAGTSVTVGTVGSEEKGTGPILYWNLNDGSGSTAYDSSMNKNNGTVNATWKSDQFCVTGTCFYTTNSGAQGVTTTTLTSFSKLTTGSVSVWARVMGTNSFQDIFNMYRNADTWATGFELAFDNRVSGGVNLYGSGNIDGITKWEFNVSSANFNAIAETGKWHLYTLAHDGTTPILYVDGKLMPITFTVTTDKTLWFKAFLTDATSKSDQLTVGTLLANNTAFNVATAFFDDFKVYSYARSEAQVKTDYNAYGTTEGVSAQLSTTNQKFLSDGLMGYWKMDEASANTCSGGTNDNCDSSGNVNDGAWNGNATTTIARIGSGVTFDGSGDYIKPPDISNMVSNSSAFTISAWVNPTTVASAGAILGHYSGNTFDFAINSSGGLYYEDAGGSYNSTASVVTANVWNHVVITHNGSNTARFYVNGRYISSATTSAVSTSGAVTSIGHAFVGDFSGKMDEVRVYKKELSDSEVANLYNWEPGPLGYWKLDEVRGATSVLDASGNSLTGTINNPGTTNIVAGAIGKFGYAIDFPSYDQDSIGITSSSLLNNLRPMTISAWVYPKGGGDIFGKSEYELLLGGTNAIEFYRTHATTDLDVVSSNNSYVTNRWQHIAVTWDGTTSATGAKIYVNGVETGYQTQTNAVGALTSDSGQQLSIGSLMSGNGFDQFYGYIDEARVYNYVRTQQQIIEDMNGGNPTGSSHFASYTSYWKMDEATGTTAHDSNSFNQNDLTLSTASSAWTTTGKINNAWVGGGTNWLSRADDSDFDFTATESFSISGWFKSNSASNPASNEYLVAKVSSSPGYAVWALTTGAICFGIDDDTTFGPDVNACTTADYYDGSWHHFVAARDTTLDTVSIYIDGVQKDSQTDPTTGTLANSASLYIGDSDGTDNGSEWNGNIDEIKVYRSALTPAQVKVEFNSGSVTYGTGASSEARQISDGIGAAAVAYWPMDENTGTAANDVSGNANVGTLTNGPTWKTGKIGSAVNFDGSNDYISAASGSTITNLSAFTVSLWINPVSIDHQTVSYFLAKDGAGVGAGSGWGMAINGTYTLGCSGSGLNMLYFYTGGTLACSTSEIPLNTWTHVEVTYASGSTKIYINGRLESTTSQTLQTDTGDLLYFGRNQAGTLLYQGLMDDVKIYGYARTAAQVSYDYNRGAPVSWWKFDECQGSTAYDASANAYNATITIGGSGTQTSVGTCATSSTAWGNGAVGRFNNAFSFDGTDDYMEKTSATNLPLAATPRTISAWVKTDGSISYEYVASYGTRTTGNWFGLAIQNTGKIFIDTWGNDTPGTAVTTIVDNTWHMVTATYDGGTSVTFYLDGKLLETDSIASPANTTGTTIRIGNSSENLYYFKGLIDDLRIYNYVLSASQVQKLYNENAGVRFGPLSGTPQP